MLFERLQVPKANQLTLLFVPKTKREAFKAGKQGNRFNGLKQRLRFMAFLEMIIRDACAEMMNVMKPDIAGEPLQDFRKFIEGTALKRCGEVIPLAPALPVNPLELVLDVEQPHSDGSRHGHDSQLEEEVFF